MRVLFVSGIDGFCHRYQVLHRARQVARLGGTSTIRHFQDPRLGAEVDSHDLLFCYRVPATTAVVSAIEAARARGCAVVGSIDDLIFVPDPDLFPELEDWTAPERDLWMDGVRRYRATLECCDAVVAPTEALCAELEAVGLRALLHRNSVSDPELALGRAAETSFAGGSERSGDEIRLGYFSGTPTHDRDFALVGPVIARLLRENARIRLRLVGPVDPGPELAALGARVERRPLVPWWCLPAEVAACDVSLAPLDLSRRFAASKGEIKYLEAAAVGVPVVASSSPAYRHAISDGQNGRLATSTAEWWAALTALVSDPGLRRRLGAAAREDVGARFVEASRARELGEVFRTMAQDRDGAARRCTARSSGGIDRNPTPARVALEPDAFPGGAAAGDPETESPPVAPGATIAQDFRPIRGGLVRLDVHTLTYGREVPGVLEIALHDERGTEIACSSVPAREVPDRAWLALDLPIPQPGSGRMLSLTVTLTADEADAAVSFALTACGADRTPARLDGRPLAGALALRVYSAWSDAGLTGCSP